MVAAAADAAHAVDPGAVVSIGGLVALKGDTYSGNNSLTGMDVGEFLSRMTQAVPSLPGKVDAVAIHLYDQDPDGDISLIGWLRSKMASAGLGAAAILVTEFGWHTQGGAGSIPEDLRAQFETDFMNQAPRLNCDVIGVAPHAWVTAEQDPTNPENWWGIASPADGSPYATGQAYSDQVHLFEGTGNAPGPAPDDPGLQRPAARPGRRRRPGPERRLPPRSHSPERVGRAVRRSAPPASADLPAAGRPDLLRRDVGQLVQRHREPPRAGGFDAAGADRPVARGRRLGADPADAEHRPELRRDLVRHGRPLPAPRPSRGARPADVHRRAGWANPSSPSDAQGAFASFLKAFAQRYGRGGTFWQRNNQLDSSQLAVRDYEIWDRGNLSQSWWDGSASAAEYASAYAAAQSALQQVDPQARALVSLDQGGVSYSTFIRDMVVADPDLAGHIDGAYVLASTSRTDPAVENVVANVRSELDDTGNPSAPIDVGFGWYTSGAGAMTEQDRADFYSQVADRLARSDCGVDGLLARSWVTPQGDPSNTSAWYGWSIRRRSSSSRPRRRIATSRALPRIRPRSGAARRGPHVLPPGPRHRRGRGPGRRRGLSARPPARRRTGHAAAGAEHRRRADADGPSRCRRASSTRRTGRRATGAPSTGRTQRSATRRAAPTPTSSPARTPSPSRPSTRSAWSGPRPATCG